jgi:hypothetical protein
MADVWATKNGNWSDTTVWNTGSLPTVVDDVFADNRTVYIDIDSIARSIRTTQRTGGTAGGSFIVSAGTALTANVLAGSTTCLTFSAAAPNTFTLTGSVTGGNTGASSGVVNTSSGTLYIFGNAQMGTSTTTHHGINNNSTGTIYMTGNVFINNTASSSGSVNNNSSGSIYLSGNATAVSTSDTSGAVRNGGQNGYVFMEGSAIGIGTGVGFVICNLGISSIIDFVGYLKGGDASSASRTAAITNNGNTSVVNITGNCFGGTGSSGSPGAYNLGTNNVINILGDSIATTGVAGVNNSSSTGVVNITGNIYGGSGNSSFGAINAAAGTLNVTGSALGGTGTSSHGIQNNSVGRVNVYGIVKGGAGSGVAGMNNNAASGFVYVQRAVGNNFGLGSAGVLGISPGVANVQNGLAYIEQVEFGPRGATPISGPVYILPSNQNTLTGVLTALGNTVTFYNTLSVDGLIPPASSVRLGTVYNVGNSIGTMAVPSASAVQFGVPVDNTVGVAALTPQTVWGYSRLSATDVGSMGDRLRNAATAQSVGSQIASFNL